MTEGAKVDPERLTRILQETSIVNVVGHYYVALEPVCVGHCPFHEHGPDDYFLASLVVNHRLGTYYCFVCQAAGNALGFVMKKENVSAPEAFETLEAIWHDTLPQEFEAAVRARMKKNKEVPHD